MPIGIMTGPFVGVYGPRPYEKQPTSDNDAFNKLRELAELQAKEIAYLESKIAACDKK